MPATGFHNSPFDEGTLTKLQIFELYAREWLPVFLSKERPIYLRLNLFDFFAGPGVDSEGQFGSPLRLLRQLRDYQRLPGWKQLQVTVHFFDASRRKIEELERNIDAHQLRLPNVNFDIRPLAFDEALAECGSALANWDTAKLVLIDQFGVSHVTPEVFQTLVGASACDFLFFLSSSTLYRFRDHPAIKLKITRPDDNYHVHRAAVEYYRELLPQGSRYYLAPFSIKKGANIYGLIFGSSHPLGIDKFLQVAWKQDEISGEADFDIDRENIIPGQPMLPLDELRPSKLAAFARELEELLRQGKLLDEAGVIRVCFEHGVKRQHAEPILKKLKQEGVIDLTFRVPDIARIKDPRPIRIKP